MRTKTLEESIVWRSDRDLGAHRQTLVEYQPGNGTRYVVLLMQHPEVAVTGPAECVIAALDERDVAPPGGWLVALLDGAGAGQCMTLQPGGWLDPSYVGKKLRLGGADALVLCELLGHLTGRPAPSALDEEGLCRRTHGE